MQLPTCRKTAEIYGDPQVSWMSPVPQASPPGSSLRRGTAKRTKGSHQESPYLLSWQWKSLKNMWKHVWKHVDKHALKVSRYKPAHGGVPSSLFHAGCLRCFPGLAAAKATWRHFSFIDAMVGEICASAWLFLIFLTVCAKCEQKDVHGFSIFSSYFEKVLGSPWTLSNVMPTSNELDQCSGLWALALYLRPVTQFYL